MIHKKYIQIMSCLIFSTLAVTAEAAQLAPGEWETTTRINTPQGSQNVQAKTCNTGTSASEIMPQQKDAHCSRWQETTSDGGRTIVLRGVCTQSGPNPGMNMTMHVGATIHVAPDGRSIRGTSQASGEVNGYAFTSPLTSFTSKYIGACSTH